LSPDISLPVCSCSSPALTSRISPSMPLTWQT
jgi:hypothetical protein